MMRKGLAALILLTLAACGADGAPEPVPTEQPRTGISIGGTASIGISGSL